MYPSFLPSSVLSGYCEPVGDLAEVIAVMCPNKDGLTFDGEIAETFGVGMTLPLVVGQVFELFHELFSVCGEQSEVCLG